MRKMYQNARYPDFLGDTKPINTIFAQLGGLAIDDFTSKYHLSHPVSYDLTSQSVSNVAEKRPTTLSMVAGETPGLVPY
jgi:hypothetical protein